MQCSVLKNGGLSMTSVCVETKAGYDSTGNIQCKTVKNSMPTFTNGHRPVLKQAQVSTIFFATELMGK